MPAPDDTAVRAALDGELRLLDPRVRRDPLQVDALLHPDFVEVGRSGRRWERADIVAALAAEPAGDSPVAVVYDLRGVRLADDVVHVTYVTERDGRRAHRSSLWVDTDGRWRAYYHQGTPTSGR